MCKMAAVGCMKDNGTLDGEDSSEKEKDILKLCKKNGIYKECLVNVIDPLDSKNARVERVQRVNGTSKSVSAIFTKPTIPSLRSRKHKSASDLMTRKKRTNKVQVTKPLPPSRKQVALVLSKRGTHGEKEKEERLQRRAQGCT